MAWWRAESPSARRAREQAEQLARLDVLPLVLADAAVAKLTGLPPIGDRDPATYTDAFVQRYEGWTFNGLRFDHRRREEGIVAWLEEFPVSCHEGSAIRSDGTSPAHAASMAHLALRELQITADDVAAIEKDVSTWSRAPGLRPEPPRPTPGPEAFELDQRPRAWALVGSAVTLLAATLVLVTLARFGGPALCVTLVALPVLGGFALFSAARLREVVFLEPATRRLRPDPIGFFDPSSGERIEWVELRAVQVWWLTVDCTLADGRTVRLAKSAFVRPDAFAFAVQRAQQEVAARYR